MKISDVTSYMEDFAPLYLQESYDNAGLIAGDQNWEVKGILTSLDCTEEIIDEAIQQQCNLIVCHHPIVFSALKKLVPRSFVERTIIHAIKNDVAIYCAHTNADNVIGGVNGKIADKLGLDHREILRPKKEELVKLVTFCPIDSAESVRAALFDVGCGSIGDYDSCSFNVEGEGTFRAGENTDPYVGKKGEMHKESEIRIETILPRQRAGIVINALKNAHPYEEVAYDLYPLLNGDQRNGSGLVGTLEKEVDINDFLKQLKLTFDVRALRHTKIIKQNIKKIAVCGGAGKFLLPDAIAAKADVFITADFKYHDFFEADNKILVADIGHYESEQYTAELFYELLKEKFPTFAVRFSEINSNPIKYL